MLHTQLAIIHGTHSYYLNTRISIEDQLGDIIEAMILKANLEHRSFILYRTSESHKTTGNI